MTGLGSSCGACKFLRRKCTNGCLFAPYFCYDQGATHFAAVHKIFGASNVSKLLSHLPVHNRSEAAMTISYEAQARVRDPIYGCVAHIYALQQQVVNLQEEIEFLSTQVSGITGNAVSHRNPQAMNNLNDFQPSSQQVGTHLCNSVDQHTPYISHAMDVIGNDQINLQLPPLYRESIGRWDHSLMSDFANEPIFLENHVLSATDQEILPNDPWLEGVVYEEY